MATITNNPYASSGANILGNSGSLPLQDSYFFANGITPPDFSNFLTVQYPQYAVFTTMMDMIGNWAPSHLTTFDWAEQERTRIACVVKSLDGGTGTANVTVTLTAPTNSDDVFQPNDVVRLKGGKQMRINTVVAVAGADFQVTASSMDNTALNAGSGLGAADKVTFLYPLQGENSDAPKSKSYRLKKQSGTMSVIRTTCSVTDIASAQRTYVTDPAGYNYWYSLNEDIAFQEHQKSREVNAFLGVSPDAALGNVLGTTGFFNTIFNGGVTGTFAGNVAETDIQDIIQKLVQNSPIKEFTVYCGSNFLKDATIAMKDYHIDGAQSYGQFGSAPKLGLMLSNYLFMGNLLHFVHLPMFDDNSIFGSDSAIDFTHMGLIVAMDKKGSSNPSMRLRYHAQDGGKIDTRAVRNILTGVPFSGNNGQVATGKAGMDILLYSTIGVECRVPHWNGLLRKA